MKMEKAIKQLAKYLGYELSVIDESLNGSRFPVEATHTERKFIEIAQEYSDVGRIRLWNLAQAFRHVITHEVSGDFVECGIKQGGSIILLQNLANQQKTTQRIFGYDLFDLPDVSDSPKLERVTKNIERNVLKPNFKLFNGPVEEALADDDNIPESLAILKIDTDWYDRTKMELETLYPRLNKGGVLIIDAYGRFKGCKKAVDDFFGNAVPWLHYVDRNCRFLIKE